MKKIISRVAANLDDFDRQGQDGVLVAEGEFYVGMESCTDSDPDDS